MTFKLPAKQHLEFLSLKGVCTGLSEPTLSKCHNVGNHVPWLKCEIEWLSVKSRGALLLSVRM